MSVADRPVVALLRSLVRIPSESGREEGVRDAVAAWLRARGVPVTVTGRNVVVVLEGAAGSDPARGLLFCSHYDTVPVGPGWTRPDPVDGALEDGKVFGRGSNDAKASIAAMMCVAAGVDRARLAGRLVFAFVCDEETGGQGLEAVAPTLPPISAAVIGEPTGLDVSPGQRGLLRAYVHETGRSCHASRPWEGVNALEAAARDVLAIRGIEMPEEHPLFGRATLAPTMLAAGTKPNVIPGAATITLDGRSTPAWDNDRMVAALTARLEGRVEVKSKRFVPIETPVTAEIVVAAAAASPTHRVRGFQGVSDLLFVRHVPGVVMGPGTSEASHAPDEWVAVAQVEAAERAYGGIVERYLKAPVREVAS
ncbi:MAG: M20/M25/M40 family metallo-hydrolase [Planctomycetia bacterium]|nr:M20/M25/M40 family metallo-hydrolase [Planctomycetia bacterium]